MDETRGKFVLKAPYQPSGDQPQAIEALTKGVNAGMKGQVLLGVTGSGKTFTMASVIAHVQRPTLVIAHNKTLAAQLCSEFRAFFPDSAVEYFVSYYDYYQPEAYIASSDTYIEKDAAINEEIDRLRHSATAALRERRDVIIVASVSCIYSMGDPSEYEGQMVSLRPGMAIGRDDLIRQLIAIQYDRNDVEFERGTFRVRGDVLEIIPAGGKEHGLRIEFFGDEIESISEFEVVSGHTLASLEHASVYPATHYATDQTNLPEKIAVIERDLKEQVDKFTKEGKLLEAERIAQRTNYDIEMMREIGYCSGIENYSRYFDGRKPGDAPYSLLDYFPKGFCASSTRATSPCRRFAPCTTATARARSSLSNMVSGCRRRLTIVRCCSRNLSSASGRRFSSPQRPARMKSATHPRLWNRLSARLGCLTPKSSSARRPVRWMTSWAKSTKSWRKNSACW